MPSGGRRMVINTQERAISTDINRLQAFLAKDRAEVWRYMLDVHAGTDDLDAAALDTEFTTQENPLRGEIMNGVLVQPQGGSLNLLVSPGVAFVLDPDTSPSTDDSSYKLIRTVGVTTLGALTITGNASGFTRIDVVECQRVENNVETDNRDIFNPISGLFTATTVTKGQASEFTYRVRAGTPNAGFPGTAQGWMPIAVVSVPNGAANVDVMTFWDVRRLVNDRIAQPFSVSRSLSRITTQVGRFIPGSKRLLGQFESEIGNRRVGGRLRPGSPQTDVDYIDFNIAANLDPGASTFTGTKGWFLYFLTPFGLPRWARYTDGPSNRVPRSPRGIPVISTTGPLQDGTPSAAIGLPTATGLGGTSSTAVCVAAGQIVGGTIYSAVYDGKQTFVGSKNDQTDWITPGFVAAAQAQWTLDNTIYNIWYPANAKALLLSFYLDFVAYPNGTYDQIIASFQINDAANDAGVGGPMPMGQIMAINNSGGVKNNVAFAYAVRVPLQQDYPTTALASRILSFNFQGMSVSPANVKLTVYGWEM